MKTTYRTFEEIRQSTLQCQWRWDGKKVEFFPKAGSGEWKVAIHTTLQDLTGDFNMKETTPTSDAETDMVNSPPHYKAHASGVECIQITEHMGFNLGNAVKYIWRADEKGKTIEDLEKARWYIVREIALRLAKES